MFGANDGEFLTVDQFLEEAGRHHGRLAAVLGRPVHHSQSPQLHNSAAQSLGLTDFQYVRVEAGELEEVRALLTSVPASVVGFSVTMPGKSAALELADTVTQRALRIGSANTLVPQGDGTWLADNTDVVGVASCLNFNADQRGLATSEAFGGTRAIVIGNGGTARPAIAALADAGVEAVTVLARSERALNVKGLVENYGMAFEWLTFDSQELTSRCVEASVVINTIPAAAVEPYVDTLCSAQSLIDVIYDPYPTPLLSAAEQRGVPHSDGLRMLAGQAEEQFRYFTGSVPPAGLMLSTVAR